MLRSSRASKSPYNSSGRIFPFTLRITREGLLYILSIFLLSFAAIRSGNNLLFIVIAALLSAIAVSGILSRNSLKQVALSLQVPENVYVGEPVSIKVSIRNQKRIFPTFSILVEDPDGIRSSSFLRRFGNRLLGRRRIAVPPSREAMLHQAAYFPILRAGETRSQYTVQSFPRRGLYRLQGFWISTRFPFGFFRRGEWVPAQGEVLVYPPVQEISAFFHLLPFLPGRMEGTHVGHGENLFALRKYQQGESARIIDWKATAKTGVLMAREYAREEELKFCLILDTCPEGEPGREYAEAFEKAVSLAASIAAHFLEEGAGIEFLTLREYIPRGTGLDHLYTILRSLAVAGYEPEPSGDAGRFWEAANFRSAGDLQSIRQVLSDKVYKIIITPKPRGSFPSALWRSSHVIFFDEL